MYACMFLVNSFLKSEPFIFSFFCVFFSCCFCKQASNIHGSQHCECCHHNGKKSREIFIIRRQPFFQTAHSKIPWLPIYICFFVQVLLLVNAMRIRYYSYRVATLVSHLLRRVVTLKKNYRNGQKGQQNTFLGIPLSTSF